MRDHEQESCKDLLYHISNTTRLPRQDIKDIKSYTIDKHFGISFNCSSRTSLEHQLVIHSNSNQIHTCIIFKIRQDQANSYWGDLQASRCCHFNYNLPLLNFLIPRCMYIVAVSLSLHISFNIL